ncbi:hypothetical protein BDL97_14G083900 [Sphagnum fallax]|nr:hypothetical protein BDL97_14G083900 [Sphagnum fallax]
MLYTSQPFKFFHTLILNEVQESVDPLFAYGSGMQKHECNATMVFSPSKLGGSVDTMSGTVSTTSSASALSSCAPMESKTTQKRTITTDDKQIKAENSGKKTRHPSAYNIFMREEMQRIKAARPLLSHRQAFGAASKSWATCPRVSGLDLAGDQEADCTNQF